MLICCFDRMDNAMIFHGDAKWPRLPMKFSGGESKEDNWQSWLNRHE